MTWLAVGIVAIVLGAFVIIWSKGFLPGLMFGLALMIVGVSLIPRAAFGHDHLRPENTDWLKSLTSKNKALCCDGNDTDAIEDWDTGRGSYRVKFRGQWFDVPESAIVDAPNKSGGAVLWMNKGWNGLSVRCFMPGSMT